MELKPGFKQTEAGFIPEGWDAVPLGKLYKFSNGVNADKAAYGKGLQFINVLEPITYSHIRGAEIPGLVELPKKVATAYTVNYGDVLFNRTSETDTELGMAAVFLGSRQVVYGGFVIRGQAISNDLDPIYAGYALRAQPIRAQIIPMGQGAVRANIGQENLRKVLILIPPKHEQRLIAEALQEADEFISCIQENISKKKQLKLAAMQELLTGKRRLQSFDGEWATVSLGSIAEMNSGGTPSTGRDSFYGGGIPWVSISDMTSSGRFISETERTLSDLGLANCAAKCFPAGTILYAMYASLGECSIAACEVTTSQAILGIRPGSSLISEYLYYWLKSIGGSVKLIGQQGTQSNLNKKMVQEFSFGLPSKDEQSAIANVLGNIDNEIDALKLKLEKTRAMKEGMVQQLLTGRIRLT